MLGKKGSKKKKSSSKKKPVDPRKRVRATETCEFSAEALDAFRGLADSTLAGIAASAGIELSELKKLIDDVAGG